MIHKRLISFAAAVCLILTMLVPAQAEMPEVVVQAAPMAKSGETADGMVRVYLSSMGSVSSLDLTIVGSYSVEGNHRLTLYDGQQVNVTFSKSSGQITVTANGTSYAMGSECVFRRHQADGESAVKIAQAKRPNNYYSGDLQLVARSESGAYKLYPIVHVYIEYYLYGVVPYEMSSSWPNEALKAQAVAARTYTLNRMNGRTGYIYDLVDTASDQVYYGYTGSESNATRAVDATRGIVIMNNGKLSGTYYTASNGGQTEAVANIWGSTAYGYLGVKDDPFDLANPNSNRRKLTVYSAFNASGQNSALKTLLTNKARSLYGSSVSITTINSITPHTPKYASPSRLYTKMDFGVTLSNGSSVTLTFDIFSELENALDFSINSSNNELWWVERDGSNFYIRVGRHGHGVGMSQRGAQQMANMGYTYDQILGFYYEGCQRVQYTFTHSILPSIGSGDDPIISTEAPATIPPETGSDARIQLVGVGDVQPLCYTPSETGKVLTVAVNGSAVKVLDYGSDWTLILYGEIAGYVPTSALAISGTPPTNSGMSATNITKWATVTGSTSLNLRDAGSYSGNVIGSIPGGTALPILSINGDWAYVQFGQQPGYCAVSYLTLHDEYPEDVEASGDSAMVSLPGGMGTVPLRSTASTSGTIILYVEHGTQVTVLSNDGTWCRVHVSGVTGYMLESALDFSATGVTPTEPPLEDDEMYAIVNSTASTLNLRSGPGTSYDVIAEIPKGTKIVVSDYGSEWCAIRWGSLTGYVMTKYLSFDVEEPTPTPTATNVPSGSAALLIADVNLYESASTSSSIQLFIPADETVIVLSYGETFSQVTYGGMTGYVLTSALQLYQDMPTPTPTPTATPTPTPTPTPEPTYTPINATGIVLVNAHLRQEADTSSAILMTIPANTIVDVLLKGSSWCQVDCAGTVGWMLTSQLYIQEKPATPTPSPTPTATPTPTPTPTPAPTEESVVTDLEITHTGRTAWIASTVTSVNLRASAYDQAEIICEIPANARITTYDSRPTWTYVVYEGESGYVYTKYISYADPVDVLGIRYINTATDPLYMRAEPSTKSDILTRIPRGSAVSLLEDAGDWCLVQYSTYTGWCATRYLSRVKPEKQVTDDTRLLDATLEDVTDWKAETDTEEDSSLFIREWCTLDAPEVAEIPDETEVELLKKGDTWCLIRYEGKEGYCLTKQLKLTPPN